MARFISMLFLFVFAGSVWAQDSLSPHPDAQYMHDRILDAITAEASQRPLSYADIVAIFEMEAQAMVAAGFPCPNGIEGIDPCAFCINCSPDPLDPNRCACCEDPTLPGCCEDPNCDPDEPLVEPFPGIYDEVAVGCREVNPAGTECVAWQVSCPPGVGDCPCNCSGCYFNDDPPFSENSIVCDDCGVDQPWSCECIEFNDSEQCITYIVTPGPNGELPPILQPGANDGQTPYAGAGPAAPGVQSAGDNAGQDNPNFKELNAHSSNQKNCNPILVSEGFKTESDIDLYVELPGENFVFQRVYNGGMLLEKPNFPWTIGRGWGTTADGWVKFQPEWTGENGQSAHPFPANITVVNFPLETSSRFFAAQDYSCENEPGDLCIPGIYYPMGPGDAVVVTNVIEYKALPGQFPNVQEVPVWTVAQSGGGQISYFRTDAGGEYADMNGRIAQRRDAYGNLWTYEYIVMEVDGGVVPKYYALLDKIWLGGIIDGQNDQRPTTRIEFDWDEPCYWDPDMQGQDETCQDSKPRIREVRALRRLTSAFHGGWLVFQRAEYTYANDDPDGLPAYRHLDARNRNLVQVKKSVLVDTPPVGMNPSSASSFYTTYVQYRYNDAYVGGSVLNTGRLTHRFDAEQIQYYAARSTHSAHDRAAEHLLTLELDDPALDERPVWELASKVISYYAEDDAAPGYTSLLGMVKSELLLSGCACTGSGHGKLLQFDYARQKVDVPGYDGLFELLPTPFRWSSVTRITENEIGEGAITVDPDDGVYSFFSLIRYKQIYHWSEDVILYRAGKTVTYGDLDWTLTTISTLRAPFVVADAIAIDDGIVAPTLNCAQSPSVSTADWWFSFHQFGEPDNDPYNIEWIGAGSEGSQLHGLVVDYTQFLRTRRYHPSVINSNDVKLDWLGSPSHAVECLPLLDMVDGDSILRPIDAFQGTFKDNEGLVELWEYSPANGRVISEMVHHGDVDLSADPADEPITLRSYQYYAPSEALENRSDLVHTSTVYFDQSLSLQIEYDYVVQEIPGSYFGKIVRMTTNTPIESGYESATPSGGTGSMSISHRLFTPQGEPLADVAPDGAITLYSYDSLTGANTCVEYNAASGRLTGLINNGDLPGEAVPDYWGRSEDGGTLKSSTVVNYAGQPLRVYDPSGTATSYHYSISSHPDPEWQSGPPSLYLTITTATHEADDPQSFSGPVIRQWANAAMSLLSTRHYTPDPVDFVNSTDNEYTCSNHEVGFFEIAAPAQDLVYREKHTYSLSGQLLSTDRWHDASLEDAYYTQSFEYDARGRLHRSVDSIGVVVKTVYDDLNRPILIKNGRVENGVDILQAQVEQFYDYDVTVPAPGSEAGDGNPTLVRTYVESDGPDDFTVRDVVTIYDWRNRPRLSYTASPGDAEHAVGGPFPVEVLNLSSRPTESFTIGSGDLSTLIGLLRSDQFTGVNDLAAIDIASWKRYSYTPRGLVHSVESAIDFNPTAPTFVSTRSWFDENGRVIASLEPGGPMSRSRYDGHGRVTRSLITDYGAGLDLAAVDNTELNQAEIVLHAELTTYDGNTGLPVLVETKRRRHDETGSGIGASPISMYQATIYDGLARPVKVVNLGTNASGPAGEVLSDGGAAPGLPFVSVPAGALVTEMRYDDLGRQHETVDPQGRVTRTSFDDLGRTIGVIDNFVQGSSPDIPDFTWNSVTGMWDLDGDGHSGPDQNRATAYVYDGNDNVTKKIAFLRSSSPVQSKRQVTEFVYTHPGDSSISFNIGNESVVHGLLYEVRYPDPTTGLPSGSPEDTVQFAYNIAGELIATIDQNATLRAYELDHLGRIVAELASDGSGVKSVIPESGPAIDFTINTLATDYDSLGRVISQRSLDGSTIRNEIRTEYDELSRAELVHFNPVGAVNIGSPPATSGVVEYQYSDLPTGSGNHSRLGAVVYPTGGPNATRATLDYGAASSTNDRISRITGIAWPLVASGNNGSHKQSYEYIGLGGIVRAHITSPGDPTSRGLVRDRIIDASTGTATPGEYPGLDRFGRVLRDSWTRGLQLPPDPASPLQAFPAIIDHAYAYNLNSIITDRADQRPRADARRTEAYEYDELNRITEAARGDFVSPLTGSQQWSLDIMGNWEGYDNASTDTSGYDDNEVRNFNATNEIDDIAGGPDAEQNNQGREFVYDHAGNLIIQQLGAGSRRLMTYDPWNRLVRVEFERDVSVVQTGNPVWDDTRTRAAYTYYAGNQRATGVVDSDLDSGAVPDQRTHFFYDAKWQLIEERVDAGYDGGWDWSDDQAPLDFVNDFDADEELLRQYIWCPHDLDRLIGFMFSTTPGGEQLPYRYAALTDRSRSVLGLQRVSEHAPASRTRYSVYGVPEVQRPGDVNGDGLVDNADRALINDAMNEELGEAAYNADADLNHDGTVDSSDLSLWSNYRFDPPPAMNAVSLLNSVIGYAGAVHDPSTGLILMRHRWYDPHLGRFITRDPAGYVDGMSLYWYATGNPVMLIDPMGLWGWFSDWKSDTWSGAKIAGSYTWDVTKALGGIAADTKESVTAAAADVTMLGLSKVGLMSDQTYTEESPYIVPLANKIESDGVVATAIDAGEAVVQSARDTAVGIVQGDPKSAATAISFIAGGAATKLSKFPSRLPTSRAPDAASATASEVAEVGPKTTPKPAPGEPWSVGTYSELTRGKRESGLGQDWQPHHVRQNAATSLSRRDGPAILMPTDLHLQTRTHSRSPANISGRTDLARDIWQLRGMMRDSGIDAQFANQQLRELIILNKDNKCF